MGYIVMHPLVVVSRMENIPALPARVLTTGLVRSVQSCLLVCTDQYTDNSALYDIDLVGLASDPAVHVAQQSRCDISRC